MDTTQYLDIFIDESTEHLDILSKQLLELEKNPKEKSIIEEIFRAAHTLKGMSATMGYQDLANLTHKLENVFDEIRYDRLQVEAHMIDVLFEAVDHLTAMVEDISAGGSGKRDIQSVAAHLEGIEKGEVHVPAEQEIKPVSLDENEEAMINDLDEFERSILSESSERGFNNFKITVTLQEDCLLKAARVFMVFDILEKHGEVIKSYPSVQELEEEKFSNTFTVLHVSKASAKVMEEKINKVSEIANVDVVAFSLLHDQDHQEHTEISNEPVQTEVSNTQENQVDVKPKVHKASSKTIRVNIERLDVLMNLFEELVIDRGRLEQISNDLHHKDLQETVERMTRVSGDLQNIILTMRMVPVDQVFSRFPRMVRQLTRDLNKNIKLEIIGAETELDRTVIDEIGDPLVHLLRNALDHGIEMPEERVRQGKPEQGTIQLKAYHSGNHVFIEIVDDGAGINKQKVTKKAIQNGIINEQEASSLTDQQIFELIMESGFSTADQVSDLSGRGVGLDVVRNKIESLGGRISIDSTEGNGSVFSIQLPLTLSIISVLLVDLKKEKYAIPLSSIIETAIIHKSDILSAHHKKVMDFRGTVVPLVDLKEVFQVETNDAQEDEYCSVVIVRKGDKLAGLVVDSFIGQQEVVLKSLGNYLSNVFAISGATILGDGQVALIIDSNALIK
ncbi:chemotaxis protein CheW [Virgibacillus soli]|uniref:chemotaxis protein CheW n=1 Tax=Paracerasibacillus soli TaxID=480284 RepID=UPI0035EFB039